MLTRSAGYDSKATGDLRHARSFAFGREGFTAGTASESRAVLDHQATNPPFAHAQGLVSPASFHQHPHYNDDHRHQQQQRSTHGGTDGDDDDSLFWAAGMLMVLIGANLVALLCEINMDDKQSLLRGLGTLNKSEGSVQSTNTSDAANANAPQPKDSDQLPYEGRHRRLTTRIVHLKW
jgi:hypothetical protein